MRLPNRNAQDFAPNRELGPGVINNLRFCSQQSPCDSRRRAISHCQTLGLPAYDFLVTSTMHAAMEGSSSSVLYGRLGVFFLLVCLITTEQSFFFLVRCELNLCALKEPVMPCRCTIARCQPLDQLRTTWLGWEEGVVGFGHVRPRGYPLC